MQLPLHRRVNVVFVFVLLQFVTAAAAIGQENAQPATTTATPAPNQTAHRFQHTTTDEQRLDYLLFLPTAYDADRSEGWPLMLFLHGAGERGSDLSRVKVHGPPKRVETNPNFPFVVVSPQCPADETWNTQTLSSLLDDVVDRHNIDVDRIYVTGLSMGGYGTWSLGLAEPERFAAIAPICGGGELLQLLLVPNTRKKALQTLPVWAFHGALDKTVPLSESERMIEGLKRLGAENVKLTVYPEAGHNSWTATYNNPAFYEWLLQHDRRHRADQTRAGNPVFEGWYADPEGIVFGDTYWIYPTYSAPYDEQLFFDCFSSKDLVTWKKHSRILEADDIQWAHRAMWAPSIIKKNGRYFLFFGANDIQNNETMGGIGVAVADKPAGPFEDHLGRPLIDKFHHGAQPIDQFVFRDADGTHYLIYGGWRHCNIAKLNEDFTDLIPFDDGTTFREITPEGYVEGPFMFIRNGKYYFMWSEGGWTGPNYSVAYAIADSPFGPFKRIAKVLQQDPKVATGAGHHSVIHVPNTDDYYAVYHRRPLGEHDGNSRVTCVDRMEFDDQGFIMPIKLTHQGVSPQQIKVDVPSDE